MLWRDACKNIGDLDLLLQRLIVHVVQVAAAQHLVAGAQQADGLGNGAGGIGVVAGDHDGADAGVGGLFQRGGDLGPGRVNHADQADEDQPFFQGGEIAGIGFVGGHSISHPQHTQRLLAHRIICRQDAHPCGLIQRGLCIIQALVKLAQLQHHIWRALGDHHILAVVFFLFIEGRNVFFA